MKAWGAIGYHLVYSILRNVPFQQDNARARAASVVKSFLCTEKHNLEVHIKTQRGRAVGQWDSSFMGLLQFPLAVF